MTKDQLGEEARLQAVEWYAWAGLLVSSAVILEARAYRSNFRHPTLSHVTRCHVRRNRITRAAFAAGMGWLVWHVLLETVEEGLDITGGESNVRNLRPSLDVAKGPRKGTRT